MVCLALTIGFFFLFYPSARIKNWVSVTSLSFQLSYNICQAQSRTLASSPQAGCGLSSVPEPTQWDFLISFLTCLGLWEHLTLQLLEKWHITTYALRKYMLKVCVRDKEKKSTLFSCW